MYGCEHSPNAILFCFMAAAIGKSMTNWPHNLPPTQATQSAVRRVSNVGPDERGSCVARRGAIKILLEAPG
jgi:hypothetical protein